MNRLIIGIFIFISTVAALQAQGVEKYSKVIISLDHYSLAQLKERGLGVDHGVYNKDRSYQTEVSASDLALLRSLGVAYEVLIDDVVQHFQEMNARGASAQRLEQINTTCAPGPANMLPVPSHWHLGSMGGYFTYNEMLYMLDSMKAQFPTLISARRSISDTLLTVEGRQVIIVKIGDHPDSVEAGEPVVLFTAMTHAREPLGMSQLLMSMYYMLEHYNTDPWVKRIMDHTQMYFVPCINVDGYLYNQSTNPTGGGMWRKNRKINGDGTTGVDLNRNFGAWWAYDNIGSSPTTSSETYRGPSAFSEPETRMIRDWSIQHTPKISIHYHTYGNDVIYPWGHISTLTPDSTTFKSIAKFITKESNYKYGTGFETVGYNTNGDSDDWGYGDSTSKPRIFSMTPECGDAFWMPSAQITSTCQNMIYTNVKTPLILLDNAVAEDHSFKVLSELNGQLHFSIQRIGIPNTDTFHVNIFPSGPGFSSLSASRNYVGLNLNQIIQDTVSYTINPSAILAGRLAYVVEISTHEGVLSRDTFEHIYQDSLQIIFFENGTNLSQWTNSGDHNWGTSNAVYHSPATSLHAPAGNAAYANNARYKIVSSDIDLRHASAAYLEFYARWDIERDYDYSEVSASTDGGSTWSPLCGEYTHSGSVNQDPGNPIYDGTQREWVLENMSLSDYLGQLIKLQISLISDPASTGDGYFVDDLQVRAKMMNSSGIANTAITSAESMNAYPNPANEKLSLQINAVSQKPAALTIRNANGQLIFDENISLENGLNVKEIAVNKWPEGFYTAQLSGANFKQQIKLVIHHQ
jgi:hypothetical protein